MPQSSDLASNSISTPLRLAVIGAGVMGRRHMNAANMSPGVTLSVVYDADADQCAAAAEQFDCFAAASLEAVCAQADAAVIATPTQAHHAVTMVCLSSGLHCLVEKPLAMTEPECRDLIDSAAVKHLVLQVGHTERFNPAIDALWTQNLAPEKILAIKACRMNPPAARAIRDDEVLDLMIHDLDVILALKQAPVLEITARNLGAEHSEAVLTFADGTKATVSASRTATERARNIEVATNTGTLHVDYAERRAWAVPSADGADDISSPQALKVESNDPLQQQLAHFAACIHGVHPPRVSGEHALTTMKLAWRIQAAMGKGA